MNREEIKQILPHREPMLLVDEAVLVDEKTASGKYFVRGDEFFLQGHFPGNPVVPGVILCEMMAQTGAVILANQMKGSTPYFTGLKLVKFRQKVFPGDTFDITCQLTQQRGSFFFAKAVGKVNGKVAASAEFSFALIS